MADRYWVGGTGNWDNTTTTRWSATSGGAGGASVPTGSDNVYFDANSGGGTCTLTVASRPCLSLSFRGLSGTSDYTGTFSVSGTSSLIIGGSLTLAPTTSMTISYSGNLTLSSALSNTITFNGQTMAAAAIFTGGGTWTCQDIVRFGGGIYLSQGTFTTTYDLYVGVISSITAGLVKAFNITGANLYLTGTGILISVNTTTLTWNADVDWYITDSSATQKTLTLGSTYPTTKNIYFGGSGSGILNFSVASGNPTLIVTNTGGASINFLQNAQLTSLIFQSGTNAFLNQTSTGRSITINKDLTFTPSQGATTTAISFTINFIASTTGTTNITSAGKSTGASITCNNASGVFNFLDAVIVGAFTITAGTCNIYGSVSAGGSLILTTGTLNANSNSFTISSFSSSSSTNVRTLNLGSGNAFWTITGNGGWGAALNGPMVITGGTGFNNTVYFTDTSNNTLTVSTNAQIPFDTVYFNRGASTGLINFSAASSGGLTFTNFIDNGTAAHTITFASNRTYIFGHFYVKGSAGNIVTLTGSSTSFGKTPLGLVSCDYISVTGINVGPTNTWYAGANSTIVSGAGWILSYPPTRKLGGGGVG